LLLFINYLKIDLQFNVLTKLRSTALQERLNSLYILTIEGEMAIHLNPEDIIDDLKYSTERRIVL
jgi:hypothetical protein